MTILVKKIKCLDCLFWTHYSYVTVYIICSVPLRSRDLGGVQNSDSQTNNSRR